MQYWTHDELHCLMEDNPVLKGKSDKEHALLRVSSEEKEQGKLQMMEIYAKAVNCKQVDIAKGFVKKAFLCLRQGTALNALCDEYAKQKSCHAPNGNDYMCFCDEEGKNNA